MGGYYAEKISDDLVQWTGRSPNVTTTQKRNLVYSVHAMSTGAVSLVGTVTVEADLDGSRGARCTVKAIQFANN